MIPSRAWVVALLCCASSLANAQSRTVTGSVLEEGTRTPLPSAQVIVKGTTIGALTRENGTFTLQVPAGAQVLTVRRIGYPQTDVRLAATASSVEVVLRRDALKLDQLVITGQATGISRRNLATSVASVSAEEVTKVSTQSIENAFQGKIAGAQISQSTGAPGGGNRIRIRGISSILGSAQPLYVVDGVIVSDVSIGSGTNKVTRAAGTSISVVTQENPANRISDLNPNDIENVEILKGSAASAIYGSKASGGVVIITTKRGDVGAPKFSLRQGIGTARLAYKNGSRRFTSVADAVAGLGASAAQYYDPSRFIDYEDVTYGEHPVNSETSLSVSGGSENTRYFVSALKRDEAGIVRNTYANKAGIRINLDQRLGSRLMMQVGSEILRTGNDRGLFGNDNAGNSIAYTLTKVPSYLDIRRNADGTFPVNPLYNSNPLQTIDLFKNGESVFRNISTARLTMDAWTSGAQKLQLIAYGGADVLNQKNVIFSPPELQYEPLDGLPGTSAVSYSDNVQSNLNLNAVHTWTPRTSVGITSQLGTQYERRTLGQSRASAQNLLGGLEVVTAGTVRDVDESRLEVNDFGLFGQTEILWNERLLLTIGARADRSSNNGDTKKFFVFPKASASYRFPELRPGLVDELKFRAAYGETGNQPLYGQKFTGLDLSSIGGLGAFRVGATRAAADIRPERQREVEGGLDAALFGNRANLEITGFQRNISDLLITRTLAPSTGYSAEISNGAAMRVRGLEVSVGGFPVQRAGYGWNTRLNYGMNRSLITDLPVPAFLIGAPQVGAVKIEEGKSATQLIGNDTLPQPGGRIVVPVVMGDGSPSWNAGWSNEVRYGAVSLYALLDHQEGGMLANGTWRHYDLGQNSRDYDELTSDGRKLGEVRRTSYLQVTRIYYQDATYTKLREVTLGWNIPTRYLQTVTSRVNNAKLSVSGRNLKWWTNFRGGDPEAQNFGAGNVPDAVQRNRELAAYPASRSYWLNLSVDF
ncbi:MAG: SusC/RagA family TonB-linked outer membrane protein [Gemmatimonadaceae bacterium]